MKQNTYKNPLKCHNELIVTKYNNKAHIYSKLL